MALVVLLASGASAADDSDRIERQRIDRERSAAQARFEAQQADCRSRFAVTACVDRARAERRDTLDHLTEQQRVLDEARRKRRAALRAAAIRARIEQAESDRASPASRAVEARAPPRRDAVGKPAPTAEPPTGATGAAPGERDAAERARREQYAARQRAAQQQREKNAERITERAKKKPRAAPLPQAPASAIR